VTSDGLADFLLGHPGAEQDAIAYSIDGELGLGELRTAAEQISLSLLAGGVTPASPVAVVVDQGFSTIAAMFGSWIAGAVFVPVNGRLTDTEITHQLGATGPAAVVTSRDALTHRGAATLLESKPLQWSVVGHSSDPAALDPRAALVMRTSGTTGESKPIVLTHENVQEGIDTSLAALRSKRPDDGQPKPAPMPNLIPSSLALWAGIWNVLFAFRSGAPVVLMDRFNAPDFATLVARHGIRSSVLAPTMMSMLVDDPTVADLAPLKMVRSITAPLTPEQAHAFSAKFGIGIMNCYGQTELGGEVVGWTAADLRQHGESKLGAVGRPHEGIELSVLDGDRRPVGIGDVGELWVRSPYVSSAPDVAAALVDGFFRTGDLGRVDAEGFLWIEGRASEVINRGGLKVMPQEVEEVLRSLPGIVDACVAGVPDERLGEVPMAWVRLDPTVAFAADLAMATARRSLAGYKMPVAIEVVADFPRNEIGKVLRKELVASWTATRPVDQ
jgi:long-chain acyl-CoA synthetase